MYKRQLQRLFRNADLTRMIRRCNDFGAGGVSVAIGELADGLRKMCIRDRSRWALTLPSLPTSKPPMKQMSSPPPS